MVLSQQQICHNTSAVLVFASVLPCSALLAAAVEKARAALLGSLGTLPGYVFI